MKFHSKQAIPTLGSMIRLLAPGLLRVLFAGVLMVRVLHAAENVPPPVIGPDHSGSTNGDAGFFHYFGIGETKYTKPDLLSLARIPLSEGFYLGRNPTTFDVSFEDLYTRNLTSSLAVIYLTLESSTISEYLLKTSSIAIKRSSNSEVIERDGAIRQVATTTTLADVTTSTSNPPVPGYKVKVYNRTAIGAKGTNGLYAVPAAAIPIAEWIMRTPNGQPFNGTVESVIINRRNSGGTHVEIRSFSWDFTTDISRKMTYEGSLDASGAGVKGNLLESETITYTDRGFLPNDFTIIRETNRITTTVAGPQYGTLLLVSRRLEEYRDFTPDDIGDIPSYKRLVREVDGYQTSDPLETVYSFYEDPSNSMVYGRLKSKVGPDGNWEFYSYTDSPGAATYQQIKHSAWRDSAFGSAEDGSQADYANARKEVLAVTSSGFTRVISCAGVVTGSEEFSTLSKTDGSLEYSLVTKSGSGIPLAILKWCLNYSGGPSHSAGKIAWMEKADGTADKYTYYSSSTVGGHNRRHWSGAGNRWGVTSGIETYTGYNSFSEAISETISNAAFPILDQWSAPSVDVLGRPTQINHTGTSRYLTFQYSWYGLSRKRDLDGSVSTWSYDSLKRNYLQSYYAHEGDTVPTSTIGYGFSGLTSSETRNGLILRETTTLLNGQIHTTDWPDDDGDDIPERLTQSTSYPYGGGKVVTTVRPSGAVEIRTYYIDGQLKSVVPSSLPYLSYTYGTDAAEGPYLWKQVATTSSDPAKNGLEKTWSDALGRRVKTEYRSDQATWALKTAMFKYFGVSAPNGSRTRLELRTDPDGTTTAFTYNAKGEVSATVETLPNGSLRQTGFVKDAINEVDLGNCLRESANVDGGVGTALLRSMDGSFKRSLFIRPDLSILGSAKIARTPYSYRPRRHSDGRPAAWHPGVLNDQAPDDPPPSQRELRE